jgi:hypothetical protein
VLLAKLSKETGNKCWASEVIKCAATEAVMKPTIGACLVLLFSGCPAFCQNTPKSIAITDKSQVPNGDIENALKKECPDVSVIIDGSKSDYRLEAIRKGGQNSTGGGDTFDLTLFRNDGKTVRSTSTGSLGSGVKDICRTIKAAVTVEVVDIENLTQSVDARGNGGIGPALTGRRTHTDTFTINVIVNGEHALLDCYEHRTGCTAIGPGKYFGELDGESIWIDYEMPLTHKPIRNHYKVAGSW